MPMIRISPGDSGNFTLYKATGKAVRFSGISKFPKRKHLSYQVINVL
jgi:hypothetical protein